MATSSKNSRGLGIKYFLCTSIRLLLNTTEWAASTSTPLTWPCVLWGTIVVRPSFPSNASILIVARQHVFAFRRSAPIAPVNLKRCQGHARFFGRSVLQWHLTCRRDAPPCDRAAQTLVPLWTVKAHRVKARSSVLLSVGITARYQATTYNRFSARCSLSRLPSI